MVFEQTGGYGGVWYANTYPGVRHCQRHLLCLVVLQTRLFPCPPLPSNPRQEW